MSRRVRGSGEQDSRAGWVVGLGAVYAQVERLSSPAFVSCRTVAAAATEGARR